MDWSNILKQCSHKMTKEILALFGSVEADELYKGEKGSTMKKIDMAAEEALIGTLNDHNVSCTLISEETGVKEIGLNPKMFYVTIDPLDGTTNAVRGLPFIAISIAVSETPYLQNVNTALVSDPIHNVNYTARKGLGAFRNEEKIHSSLTSSLKEAVISIRLNTSKARENIESLTGLIKKTRHLRYLGANALELCHVADGTTDAFIGLRGKLRVTDIAAAYLILREAGGIMVTLEGKELDAPLTSTQRVSFIAAANTLLYEPIKKLLLSH